MDFQCLEQDCKNVFRRGINRTRDLEAQYSGNGKLVM